MSHEDVIVGEDLVACPSLLSHRKTVRAQGDQAAWWRLVRDFRKATRWARRCQ